MDQILEKLFESSGRVRILRLLLQNTEELFTISAISKKTKVRPQTVRGELVKLAGVGLVKRKSDQYGVNPLFTLLKELRDLVVKSSVASRKGLVQGIKRLGRVRLVILSGVFINNENSRTDLLIVGDDIKKRKIERFLQNTESELGKSIRYTVMDTDEFKYRMNMYDRFLKDIIEFPHEKLINKLGI